MLICALLAGDVIDMVGGVVSTVNFIEDVVATLPALSVACAVTVCDPDNKATEVYDQEVVPLAEKYALVSILTCTSCTPDPESDAVP